MKETEPLNAFERDQLLRLGFINIEIWVPAASVSELQKSANAHARTILRQLSGGLVADASAVKSELENLCEALKADAIAGAVGQPEREPSLSIGEAVVSSVFSIQAKYEAWANVRDRFRKYAIEQSGSVAASSLDDFRAHFDGMVIEGIFNNQFLSGRQKYDVVRELLDVLDDLDLKKIAVMKPWDIESLFCSMQKVHGIGPAVVQFFLIKCGRDDFVKGDTMVTSYVSRAIGRNIDATRAVHLLTAAAKQVSMTPASLDLAVWRYERDYRKKNR